MSIVEYEASQPLNVMTETQSGRAAQEVQAAMIIAKRYPRDENAAIIKIRNACKRRKLAEMAVYTYPRGTTKVDLPAAPPGEANPLLPLTRSRPRGHDRATETV